MESNGKLPTEGAKSSDSQFAFVSERVPVGVLKRKVAERPQSAWAVGCCWTCCFGVGVKFEKDTPFCI